MRIVIERDSEAVAKRAALRVATQVRQKPSGVIGFPTGRTALPLYRELVRMHRQEGLDFSSLVGFILDEYIGLEADHPQSFRTFMKRHLFDQVNFDPSRVHTPDGCASDLTAECQRYEESIRTAGGIDLQILGVGASGHIAFNEPGSSLASLTRVKTLTRETRERNAQLFEGSTEIPRLAITLGVGTILSAHTCLLLATGDEKARAIRDTVEGAVTSQVPASALQLHPNVLVVIDEAAASWLERRAYYREMEEAQRQLEAQWAAKAG